MPSNFERMQKLFPTCPICKSGYGYEDSSFIPDVKCKSCEAEWTVFEDGLKLVISPNWLSNQTLVGKKQSFEFWEKLGYVEVSGKKYSSVVYAGGNPDYMNGVTGDVTVKPCGLRYASSDASPYKMDVDISLEKLKGVEIRTAKEITFARWFLIGAWSILFKEDKEYLVLTYDDNSGLEKHMVFDFKAGGKYELTSLISYLKRKKSFNNGAQPYAKRVTDQKNYQPIEILKTRYAKGEISKEQYEEMKRTLES